MFQSKPFSMVRNLVFAVVALSAQARADSGLVLDDFSAATEPRSVVVVGPPLIKNDSAELRDFVPALIVQAQRPPPPTRWTN